MFQILQAFGGQAARQGGNYTPRTLNSLTAIAGHEGEEEEWEREMRGLRNNEDDVSVRYPPFSSYSPILTTHLAIFFHLRPGPWGC